MALPTSSNSVNSAHFPLKIAVLPVRFQVARSLIGAKNEDGCLWKQPHKD
jgi:hypothetical protein